MLFYKLLLFALLASAYGRSTILGGGYGSVGGLYGGPLSSRIGTSSIYSGSSKWTSNTAGSKYGKYGNKSNKGDTAGLMRCADTCHKTNVRDKGVWTNEAGEKNKDCYNDCLRKNGFPVEENLKNLH